MKYHELLRHSANASLLTACKILHAVSSIEVLEVFVSSRRRRRGTRCFTSFVLRALCFKNKRDHTFDKMLNARHLFVEMFKISESKDQSKLSGFEILSFSNDSLFLCLFSSFFSFFLLSTLRSRGEQQKRRNKEANSKNSPPLNACCPSLSSDGEPSKLAGPLSAPPVAL